MNPQLLLRVRPRTAHLVLLGCVLLWAAAALNLLEPPVGTPPAAMLLILYFAPLAVILSLVLAVAAVAVVVLHRRAEAEGRPEGVEATVPPESAG